MRHSLGTAALHQGCHQSCGKNKKMSDLHQHLQHLTGAIAALSSMCSTSKHPVLAHTLDTSQALTST
eukprot:1152015-Pelagomonas_calceolata.AAC.6